MAKTASRRRVTREPPTLKRQDEKRVYVSQSDVPAYSLEQALRVPAAINDHYAGKGTTPLRVASALDMQPMSSTFRQLCGAAIAYGLTEGGYNSKEIQLTPLAKQILRPTREGGELDAKREAFLRPRVIGDFLRKYDGSKFPRDDIARNVLEDMGVPRERTDKVLEIIAQSASTLQLIETIKDTRYVHLDAGAAEAAHEVNSVMTRPLDGDPDAGGASVVEAEYDPAEEDSAHEEEGQAMGGGVDRSRVMRRVYVSHGKNRTLLDLLKKSLKIAELEAVLSVESESASIPVPVKVMREMRSCGAALIHVDAEQLAGTNGDSSPSGVNPNVLVEIGAAMALYGKRYILLVKDGVKLPSNLQGIYELRYTGEDLAGADAFRLLEAIAELKKQPLPALWIEDE